MIHRLNSVLFGAQKDAYFQKYCLFTRKNSGKNVVSLIHLNLELVKSLAAAEWTEEARSQLDGRARFHGAEGAKRPERSETGSGRRAGGVPPESTEPLTNIYGSCQIYSRGGSGAPAKSKRFFDPVKIGGFLSSFWLSRQ